MNLRIFVSGKEGELDNERMMIRKTIEELGYIFQGSEGRYASDKPIKDEYTEEVLTSEIYVGIIGSENSEPTINEFKIARGNKTPTLVFVKQLSLDDQPRPESLKSFLNEIKDHKKGITVSEFRNVIELKNQFILSLAHLLTDKFKETRNQEKEKPPQQNFMPHFEINSNQNLGVGEITEFNFPDRVFRGQKYEVFAKFEGSARFAFLDLMVTDSQKKKRNWFPDPEKWDSINDEGKLNISNNSYSNTWQFVIPKNFPVGEGIAFMGFYEDTIFLPTRNRRLISEKVKKFTIV